MHLIHLSCTSLWVKNENLNNFLHSANKRTETINIGRKVDWKATQLHIWWLWHGYVAWEPLGTHLPIVFPRCRKGKTMRTSSFFVCFIFCLSWAKQMSWKNGSAENWSNVPNDFCFLKNSDTSAVMFTTWKFLLIIPYLLIWLWLMKWKVCML